MLLHDETKMELECTKGGKSKTDTIVKWAPGDDGTTVGSKCASAVCGRLGDGRALSVFMCYAFRDFYAHAWAPHYVRVPRHF